MSFMSRPGKARQGALRQGRARDSFMTAMGLLLTWQGRARQVWARLGQAWYG